MIMMMTMMTITLIMMTPKDTFKNAPVPGFSRHYSFLLLLRSVFFCFASQLSVHSARQFRRQRKDTETLFTFFERAISLLPYERAGKREAMSGEGKGMDNLLSD